MSEGYRNGAFALGLVTGIGLAANLVVWSAYFANKNAEADAGKNEQYEHGGSPQVEDFWGWFYATFIDPNDTIAQWLMAALSLAAVYLLWETLQASRRTLRATQDMAKDTREIGEAQTTSYMVVEHADIRPLKVGIWVDITIKNVGSTPANNVMAWVKVRPYNVSFPKSINPFSMEKLVEFQTVEHGAARPGTTVFISKTDGEFISMASGSGAKTYSAEIRVLWDDVFGRSHRSWFRMGTPDHSARFAIGEEHARRMLASRSEFSKESGTDDD